MNDLEKNDRFIIERPNFPEDFKNDLFFTKRMIFSNKLSNKKDTFYCKNDFIERTILLNDRSARK